MDLENSLTRKMEKYSKRIKKPKSFKKVFKDSLTNLVDSKTDKIPLTIDLLIDECNEARLETTNGFETIKPKMEVFKGEDAWEEAEI